MSVSLLVGLLSYWNNTNIGISSVLYDISSWNFWRHFWDVCITFKNIFIFCMSVSLLVCLLPYWNKTKLYLQFWMRYLSGIFWDFPEVLVHCIQKNQISLYVHQSGSWQTSLMKSDNFRDIASSGWDIFLNLYGHIPGMLVHLFQIILNF